MQTSDANDQLKDLFGWLEKTGKEGLKLAKKRWFAYSPASGLLFYYASPNDVTPLGSYDIRSAAFRMRVDQNADPLEIESQFEIVLSKDNIVQLKAPSRDAALWWITRLQRARKFLSSSEPVLQLAQHSRSKNSLSEVDGSELARVRSDSSAKCSDSEGTATAGGCADTHCVSASELMLKEKVDSIKVRAMMSVGVESAQSERRSLADLSVKHLTTELRNVVSRFKQRNRQDLTSRFYVDLDGRTSSLDSLEAVTSQSQGTLEQQASTVDKGQNASCDSDSLSEGDVSYRSAALRAFQDQNAILSGEILELLSLRKKDEQDIAELLKKVVELERLFRDSELRYQRFVKYLAASHCPHCGKQLALRPDGVVDVASKPQPPPPPRPSPRTDRLVDLNCTTPVSSAVATQRQSTMTREDLKDEREARLLLAMEDANKKVDVDAFIRDIADRELVDRYGFASSSRFSNDPVAVLSAIRAGETDRNRRRSHDRELEARWDLLIVAQKAKSGRSTWQSELDCLERNDELRGLVRLGVPDKYRSAFWNWCVQQLLKNVQRGKLDYRELLKPLQQSAVDSTTRNQIEVDLFRTFSTNLHFRHDFQQYTTSLRAKAAAKQTGISENVAQPSKARDKQSELLIQLDEVQPTESGDTRSSVPQRHSNNFNELLQIFQQASPQSPTSDTNIVEQNRLQMQASAKNAGSQFAESAEIQQLRNILLAFCAHNKAVGYCQGLNRLAGLLLVVLADEEQAFYALCALTECILPADYFSETFLGLRKDLFVFERLLAQKRPVLHSHLEKLSVDPNIFVCRWFLTCFLDSGLPIELILTIWDSLLYEGLKILFRFSLALLLDAERVLLRLDNTEKLLTHLQTLGAEFKTSHVHQFRLLEVAFRDTNPLSMNLIRRLQDEFVDGSKKLPAN